MTVPKIYLSVKFSDINESQKELISAHFSLFDHNGIEEKEDSVHIYFEESYFEENALKAIAAELNLSYDIEKVPSQNWNEEWEKNFEPIIIEDFCCIRADFHDKPKNVTHDIVITPKMSFGTGHHATTWQMISLMKDMNFERKSVLDFGTGTGILAILASKLNAKKLIAIDIDEWSYENATDNFKQNSVDIELKLGSLEIVEKNNFDIVLANINLHILKMYHSSIWQLINPNGFLLISGILVSDIPEITEDFANQGFKVIHKNSKDNWAAILLQK